jgi:hypothetical protein
LVAYANRIAEGSESVGVCVRRANGADQFRFQNLLIKREDGIKDLILGDGGTFCFGKAGLKPFQFC